MNRKLFRVTALLLAAMMLALSLAACGGDTNKPDDDGNNAVNGNNGNNGNGNGSSGDNAYADFVYTAAYQKVKTEDGIRNMDNLVYANDKLYMIAGIITGKEVEYYDENGTSSRTRKRSQTANTLKNTSTTRRKRPFAA